MFKHIKPENVFVFYNGIIGTVTKGGRIALVSPSGAALAPHRQPNALAYIRSHEVKRIEESYPDPHPLAKKDDVLYRTLWVNPQELGIEFKLAA